jgi:hypothetical protein
MANSWCARQLLREAALLFDDPHCPLTKEARSAGNTLFASGARWMRHALEWIRGAPITDSSWDFNALGFVKYGLASVGALACLALAWLSNPWWIMGVVPVFYAIEAQMVFLFPLALDGTPQPFREARRWTKRAGGTLAVMAVVLPLAATMLFGGFVGRGFVRSWCLGCLAVCLWYEDLRISNAEPKKILC